MIECPTCHAVPREGRGARRDLAEGGQINDTGSHKSIRTGRRRGAARAEGGRIGSAACRFNFGAAVSRDDDARERRAISPRLGAFRGPLIAAITVIIDLLRGRVHRSILELAARPISHHTQVSRHKSLRALSRERRDTPADATAAQTRSRRKQDLADVTRRYVGDQCSG